MGKITGFLEYERKMPSCRPVKERLGDYKEVNKRLPEEVLKEQAARCMDCGIPFCHAIGCPLYNLIPEWNDAVYNGQWYEAYKRLDMTNNFPEITGRICPAPCETSCTLSINSSPVTIKQVELAVIEKAFKEGWVEPQPPETETGKRVAVVGSGPAGLAAAQQLRRAGHSVTIFEKSQKAGGILRYGIPDFKLDKSVIDRRLDQMKKEGVEFETGAVIGDDISASYLKKKFDAVLLTKGAGEPRDLNVPGRGLEGIEFAMDYLTQSNRFVGKEISKEEQTINAKDKTVLVIGGGDTGSDCVGTANRQGAKKVIQYEIMPKPLEWDKTWNPEWPEWPGILRTTSSHEEGCERDWAVSTKRFSGRGVKVENGTFVRVEWENKNGRFRMKEVPDSEFTMKVDLVVLAMGFVHVVHGSLIKDLGVKLDERGNIKTDKPYRTSVDSVFTAGDSNTGASLVVKAIYTGREAAREVDEYLINKK